MTLKLLADGDGDVTGWRPWDLASDATDLQPDYDAASAAL